MRFLRFRIYVLLAVTLSWSSLALAQNQAAAEALFRSAKDAEDQGDWITACDRFQESYRLEPTPGTVLNLARCREKLGQVASAWKSYAEAAERLPASDRRATFARKRAEELAPSVPKLTLDATSLGAEDVKVEVDGVVLQKATFGVPLPFDPGPHQVTVVAPGHEKWSEQVDLGSGDKVTVVLQLGPEASAAQSQKGGDSEVGQEGAPRRSPLAYVLLATGGVGAAVGVTGAVWSFVELGKTRDNCEEGRCNQAGLDASDRGKTAVALTAAGAGVAVLGLGLGTFLYVKTGKSESVAFTPTVGGGIMTMESSF